MPLMPDVDKIVCGSLVLMTSRAHTLLSKEIEIS